MHIGELNVVDGYEKQSLTGLQFSHIGVQSCLSSERVSLHFVKTFGGYSYILKRWGVEIRIESGEIKNETNVI